MKDASPLAPATMALEVRWKTALDEINFESEANNLP
jgi:hypothetical protein